jgi:phage terminase large subunit
MPLSTLSVKGKHNTKNAMAATMAAQLLKVRKEFIKESLSSFEGAEHRLENVAKIDGIEYIKSFDQVIIHERCKHTANEFATYSYKVDERSGDITNKIIDANNHILDALRYSLERCMKRSKIDYANKMKLNAGRF